MKDLTITAIIKVYQYDELNEADQSLMKTAMEATARSYAPYSHFSVGAAALLNDGTIVTGTNQENAAYPSALRGTYYPVLCQLAVSRPTDQDPRYCSKNRKGFYRKTYSSLRRLPPGYSGDGETLRTTDPHSAIWQRMYLRSKKHRRLTATII